MLNKAFLAIIRLQLLGKSHITCFGKHQFVQTATSHASFSEIDSGSSFSEYVSFFFIMSNSEYQDYNFHLLYTFS